MGSRASSFGDVMRRSKRKRLCRERRRQRGIRVEVWATEMIESMRVMSLQLKTLVAVTNDLAQMAKRAGYRP